MALNPALDAALKGAAPLVCLLLKMELPGHAIRASEAGEVEFNGEVFTGEDAIYGSLDNIESLSEQVGTEAPLVRLTFLPKTLTALADLTNPANQGSPVTLWFGAIDPATGLLIGEPELLFFGELDTADVDVSEASTVITFNVTSAWERLFEPSEGQRLNNAFIQSIYPGAKGAEFIVSIQRDLPWGYDAPRPRVVADVIGGQPGQGGSPVGGSGFGGGGGFNPIRDAVYV